MNDYLLNTIANDLQMTGGDLQTGFADEQNQRVLLVSEKGAFKQFPGVGVGLFSFLENDDPAALFSEIRRQFTADGMAINRMTYLGAGKINIDASY